MPKVSVNIPCFNSERYIAETLQSVLSQTFEDFEIILVNDGSTDMTEEIIKTFSDPRIKYYSQKNIGLGKTRNRQLALSSGDFIAFCDDDDIWLPAKLEKQVDLLKENPKAVASSCWFRANYPWGKRIIRTTSNPDLQQILSANVLGTASVCMVRRPVVIKIGGFSKNFPSAQDWDFWVKLRRLGPIVEVGEVLVNYSVHRGPKISTDLTSKYIGFRLFYLKYKLLMSNNTRWNVLATVAYIKSRRAGNLRMKFLWLTKSLRWGKGFTKKAGYVFSVLRHLK